MRLAIMQPYFFPYIGYFQLMHAVDQFVCFDDVNYISQGWINRNRILADGEGVLFSLPLKKASQNRLICEIEISGEYEKWRDKFLKSLQHQYVKAPNYSQAMAVIEDILSNREKGLAAYLFSSLEKLSEYLGLPCRLSRSATDSLINSRELRGEERIIHMAQTLGARHYINAGGGMELYNSQNFAKHGLELTFLKSREVKYRQFGDHFVPWLSIIDVMMFCKHSETASILGEHDLIPGALSGKSAFDGATA